MTPYKPGFWETPRNIAIFVGVVAVIFSYIGFDSGRELARRSSPILVILVQLSAAPPK